MALRIDSVEKVSVTTTAKDVEVNYRAFMIQNLTSDKVVYFKEKADDGVKCTASNGFAVMTGTLNKVFSAKTLSVIGSDSCDARILYVTEEE